MFFVFQDHFLSPIPQSVCSRVSSPSPISPDQSFNLPLFNTVDFCSDMALIDLMYSQVRHSLLHCFNAHEKV